jgi:hypothetical protein
VVVWNLLLQADSGGSSPISDKAFTAHNLTAPGEIFLARFGHLAEDYDLMPFRSLLALALLICVGLVSRHRKASDCLPIGQIPEFRLLSEMTDDGYPVQRHFTYLHVGSASGVLPVRGAFVIPLFGFLLPASALAEGRFSAYASKNIIPWPVSP